jgi:hypothetical protein
MDWAAQTQALYPGQQGQARPDRAESGAMSALDAFQMARALGTKLANIGIR